MQELHCPAKTEQKLALGGWHSANALALLFHSKTKKIKYFMDPPPPKKKAQGYKRLQYGYTHMCLFIPAACDMDFY